MRINKVRVKNFRLLADVELLLENETTVIVGRNNSGKTSLSEIIRRFLLDSSPKFQIEDFSISSYDGFCDALEAKYAGKEDDEIRSYIPYIEVRLYFEYCAAHPELGPLSDFVIDVDSSCNQALVVARYELDDGKIEALLDGHSTDTLTEETRHLFFRALRERIPDHFSSKVWAEDPNDPTNQKKMSVAALRSLLRTGFVNAQRGLDDTTSKEADILAKVLETLFTTAMSPTAGQDDQLIAAALQDAVRDIQQRIDDDFNVKLRGLIPTLETFGYPGLGGPEMTTETTLDVKRLLSNYTKVRYAGHSGILFPESYNGLGIRNLIFILLQIVSFYKAFRAEASAPGVFLVFIEEPEAHLHPQMQEVFIRQLSKLAAQLNSQEGQDIPWPAQFVVSTHSSHVANAAGFESIRYFLPTTAMGLEAIRYTEIKDLRKGLRDTSEEHKKFLHQYLTLTRCDLFFADKAVLVEGTSERMLLPMMIKKLEALEPNGPKLSSQYLTILEVGGAYAHIFFTLLDFLEVRTLIITDLDSVTAAGGTACPVHQGTATSNTCIKSWFTDDACIPSTLLAKTDAEKVKVHKRIAYQCPEVINGPCGRTFEDAFMLANSALCGLRGVTSNEQEIDASNQVQRIKKSQFALKHVFEETRWSPPAYILEGLRWLMAGDASLRGGEAASECMTVAAAEIGVGESRE